jgi:hypothetical protein
MIKLAVEKDDPQKNYKLNLTPDVLMVKEALDYFDTNQDKIIDLINKTYYINVNITQNNFEHNTINLYDINENIIETAKYEFIGIYDTRTTLWTWAWAVPSFTKKTTIILRKILNYGVELESKNDFLKTELITSRFRITNKIQIDIFSAIVSYLSKKPRIFKFKLFTDYNIVDKKINNESIKLIDIKNPHPNTKDLSYVEYYIFLLD